MERCISVMAVTSLPAVGMWHLAVPQRHAQRGGHLDVTLAGQLLHTPPSPPVCVQPGCGRHHQPGQRPGTRV